MSARVWCIYDCEKKCDRCGQCQVDYEALYREQVAENERLRKSLAEKDEKSKRLSDCCDALEDELDAKDSKIVYRVKGDLGCRNHPIDTIEAGRSYLDYVRKTFDESAKLYKVTTKWDEVK